MSTRTLREIRLDHLLSVRELAEAADITPKTLTDIELGKRMPTYETMRNLCRVLGIEAHDVTEFVTTIQARARRISDEVAGILL